jgi:hypothetical protein
MIGPMSFAGWLTAAGFVLGATQFQESTLPQLVIKTDVRQVLVPAVVLDRSGHPVQGLNASDFEVLEDGRPTADRGIRGAEGWRCCAYDSPGGEHHRSTRRRWRSTGSS